MNKRILSKRRNKLIKRSKKRITLYKQSIIKLNKELMFQYDLDEQMVFMLKNRICDCPYGENVDELAKTVKLDILLGAI